MLLKLSGYAHVLRALQHLRINNVSNNCLVFTGQILIEEFNQVGAGNFRSTWRCCGTHVPPLKPSLRLLDTRAKRFWEGQTFRPRWCAVLNYVRPAPRALSRSVAWGPRDFTKASAWRSASSLAMP